MKKLMAALLATLMMTAVLAGCGGDNGADTSTSTSTSTSTDTSTSGDETADGEGFVLLDENFGDEQYGIAFRKGDNDLALEVDRLLEEMETDGKAAEISETWFGTDILLKGADYLDPSISENTGDGSLDYVKEKGTFIVGLDASFPPMGFMNEAGEIVGFDIDLAKEVASRMGVELVLQPINWNAKEMELNGKNIDVIWNGMSINEERLAAMTFARPYLDNKQVVIVPADSDIKSKADLEGKIVGLQEGSSAMGAVEADAETMAIIGEIQKYEDNVSAFADLKVGRVDAVVMDEVVARYLMSQNQ
ncbi:MAG: transporter substrate-binding domain-containing protein [Eubacteriales bacterium]|jgi:ABC-type amino acid transport substrate-binding protein